MINIGGTACVGASGMAVKGGSGGTAGSFNPRPWLRKARSTFRAAESPNAAPYQTQINNELRRIMENDSLEKSVEKDILNNEEFLRSLKEKLETV